MIRRALLKVLAAAALAGSAWPALAQAPAFPTRPVRMIVPFAPGGATDLIARALAKELAVQLGQPVVVDNKPGAAGMVGLDALTASPADGYTIAQLPNATISAMVFAKKPLNLQKRFVPIGNATLGYMLVAVNPKVVDVRNVAELVAWMKTHPDLPYSTSGQGSPSQLAIEALAMQEHVKPLHVPFKGLAPATVELLAGRLAMLVAGSSTIAPHMGTGAMRPIASLSSIRSPAAPQVPTVAEQGFAQFNYDPQQGVVAPPGTPQPVVDRLRAAVKAAVTSDNFVRAMRDADTSAHFVDGPAWGESLTRDYQRWTEIVQKTGITAE